MKQLEYREGCPSGHRPQSTFEKIKAKFKRAGAVCAVLLATACVMPSNNFDIFSPSNGRGATIPLTEGISRSFERATWRSANYRVELSGEDGAFGSWAYYRLKQSNVTDLVFYEIQPNISQFHDEETVAYVGVGSGDFFNVRPEPARLVGSDVFIAAHAGRVLFAYYNSLTAEYETTSVRFDSGMVGPEHSVDVLYSERASSILVLFSSADASTPRLVRVRFDLSNAGHSVDYYGQAGLAREVESE